MLGWPEEVRCGYRTDLGGVAWASIRKKCVNASYASIGSLGTHWLALAEIPRSPVTGPEETSIGGTILGPFFSFRVLPNGLECSRMLSKSHFSGCGAGSVNP